MQHAHVQAEIANTQSALTELRTDIKKGMWFLVTILGGLVVNLIMTFMDRVPN